MKDLFEKWNEFIAEEDDVRDTYDDEVEKRNEKSRKQGAEKMGLEERCQKGYKTHPTRKTKTMYGKTYRNCIKAEGEELEEKKDDRCTRIAKRKYDVWPSAYASGAVVRCRAGKIWKGVKESVEVSDLEIKIRQALHDEGGAAGIEGLVKKVGASEDEIIDAIKGMEDVGHHHYGDYILDDADQINVMREKKWSDKYKKSIDCDNPKGFSQKAHCAGRKKQNEATLDEKKKKRKKRKKKKAGSESSKEGSLRDWFGRKGAPGKKGGWVDCNTCRKDKKTGRKKCKPCGRQKGEKRAKYPSCRPTPGACGERGRGKSWGKKSAKKRKRNEALDKMKITKEELEQIIFEETREVYYETFIFPYLTEASLEDGTPVCTACLYELLDEASCDCPHLVYEAEYQGRKVTLNKPTRGDVKKFKVYVKDPKTGNVKKVNFGDPNMRIKKSNPKRRKSFRARHNCDNPGPKTKARYWSCKKW